MFSSIQSIPGLIFARSDVKAKIQPGVEARVCSWSVTQLWALTLSVHLCIVRVLYMLCHMTVTWSQKLR